jgi:hypothetical protein
MGLLIYTWNKLKSTPYIPGLKAKVLQRHLVNKVLLIPTFDGYYIARPGDWVIRDAHGNFFVYTADTFNELFEEVNC